MPFDMNALMEMIGQGNTIVPGNMSPGGMSMLTPGGKDMSVPMPKNAQNKIDWKGAENAGPYPSNVNPQGVMQQALGSQRPQAPSPMAPPVPEESGGIFSNITKKWDSMSDDDKSQMLSRIGSGMMSNSRGKSMISSLGDSIGEYHKYSDANKKSKKAGADKERDYQLSKRKVDITEAQNDKKLGPYEKLRNEAVLKELGRENEYEDDDARNERMKFIEGHIAGLPRGSERRLPPQQVQPTPQQSQIPQGPMSQEKVDRLRAMRAARMNGA